MRRALQILLPLAILALVGLLIWVLGDNRPEAKAVVPAYQPPLIQTTPAATRSERFVVRSQGTVEPRSEIDLITQVSGRLLTLSLHDGEFFTAGETVATLDDADYRAAAAMRRAELAQAELHLAREKAEADTAIEQWRNHNPNARPPELVARRPQLAEASARVEAAAAAVARAQLDLQRAEIRAPFDGRVRQRLVDEHQVVTAGQALARIYATDFVEVRLPVATGELEFLEMPYAMRPGAAQDAGPEVTFEADYAGQTWSWTGRIHRVAGAVDAATRRVTLIARVDDPFGLQDGDGGPANGTAASGTQTAPKPPLQVGMFVRAKIHGKPTGELLAVPRSAVRNGNQLLVLDRDWRVRIRDVEIARSEADRAWIRKGIEPEVPVITSNLQAVVDGMQVLVDGAEIPNHVQRAIEARRNRGGGGPDAADPADPAVGEIQ